MKKIFSIIAGIACMSMVACSNESIEENTEPSEPEEAPIAAHISTRADNNLASQVGVFMVYGSMQSADNYLNNMCLTNEGNGNWSSDQQIYWKDKTTHTDFYAYSPYAANIADALAHSFQVQTDQSNAEKQKSSDFLWGKLVDQKPTGEVLNMTLGHIFSRAIIRVTPGEGFTEDELKNGTLSVRINGVRIQATIDLANGNVTAAGSAQTIIPMKEQDLTYSAIVVPQQVEKTGLVTVSWSGTDYTFTSSMQFASAKQYTFTVTMKKTAGGINVGIGGWEDAGEDFGGTVN